MTTPRPGTDEATAAARLAVADGRVLQERGDWRSAQQAYLRAAHLAPDLIEPAARLAEVCALLGDWPDAAAAWRRVLVLRPNLAVAVTGLATALHELGQWDLAEAEFQHLVQLQPQLADSHFNLGYHYYGIGDLARAEECFYRALEIAPTHSGARWHLALSLLKGGDFRRGAIAYEVRWDTELRGQQRPFTAPRWDGRPLPHGRLLLWGEQGIGEEIMFSGLVPAAAAGIPCLVEADPRLVPLFTRSFPGIDTFPRTTPPLRDLGASTITAQAPLGALPGLLWPADGDPTPPLPHLRADPDVARLFRDRLGALGAERKVGIAWRGGAAGGRVRRIPPETWKQLFARPDVTPVSLQHGATRDEIAAITSATGRTPVAFHDVDPLVDLDRFAALVSTLDAVIAVDNSTVHLAGALGVPTAVLLGPDADWRWGLPEVPCPWYRTVTRCRRMPGAPWDRALHTAIEAVLPDRP